MHEPPFQSFQRKAGDQGSGHGGVEAHADVGQQPIDEEERAELNGERAEKARQLAGPDEASGPVEVGARQHRQQRDDWIEYQELAEPRPPYGHMPDVVESILDGAVEEVASGQGEGQTQSAGSAGGDLLRKRREFADHVAHVRQSLG